MSERLKHKNKNHVPPSTKVNFEFLCLIKLKQTATTNKWHYSSECIIISIIVLYCFCLIVCDLIGFILNEVDFRHTATLSLVTRLILSFDIWDSDQLAFDSSSVHHNGLPTFGCPSILSTNVCDFMTKTMDCALHWPSLLTTLAVVDSVIKVLILQVWLERPWESLESACLNWTHIIVELICLSVCAFDLLSVHVWCVHLVVFVLLLLCPFDCCRAPPPSTSSLLSEGRSWRWAGDGCGGAVPPCQRVWLGALHPRGAMPTPASRGACKPPHTSCEQCILETKSRKKKCSDLLAASLPFHLREQPTRSVFGS